MAVVAVACAVTAARMRLVVDRQGITVYNPFRRHVVAWQEIGRVVVGAGRYGDADSAALELADGRQLSLLALTRCAGAGPDPGCDRRRAWRRRCSSGGSSTAWRRRSRSRAERWPAPHAGLAAGGFGR
jgi:hypothetical protein